MHLATKLALAVLGFGLCITPALAEDPTGTWQSTTGESRYHVSYCGDGTQLCAKLTWLRTDARTDENLALLNRYVVRGASAVDDNEWQGQLTYNGDTYQGRVKLTGDSITMRGCKGVFCQSMKFKRV